MPNRCITWNNKCGSIKDNSSVQKERGKDIYCFNALPLNAACAWKPDLDLFIPFVMRMGGLPWRSDEEQHNRKFDLGLGGSGSGCDIECWGASRSGSRQWRRSPMAGSTRVCEGRKEKAKTRVCVGPQRQMYFIPMFRVFPIPTSGKERAAYPGIAQLERLLDTVDLHESWNNRSQPIEVAAANGWRDTGLVFSLYSRKHMRSGVLLIWLFGICIGSASMLAS